MTKHWLEIFDIKPWFEAFDFHIKVNIRYTNEEGQIKPYLSAFSVSLDALYPHLQTITIAVFPQSDKLELLYGNSYNYVIAKVPIEYAGLTSHFMPVEETLDHINLPDYVKDYLKRVLKLILDKFYVRDDPLKFLSALNQGDTNALDELHKLIQTIHIYGTIYDKGDNRKDIGKVSIYDYFAINGKTEYNDIYDYFDSVDYDEAEQYVTKKSFVIQKSSDGELTAVEKVGDRELFNPTYQTMLSVIIPSKTEFEDLVQFVKDVIKEKGEAEYGDKNAVL
ncbi:hypothetical protein [Sulfolobus monocaudavirus SMV3]|uniref:hypothetical protein n=1 Tax=Sulfolobus monocaudavirus SMV3 TaxID=1732177 RepID=UPI0007069C0A|nr:hypothetical protein AXI69_gp55 [Sulfolobus monocaudavirus SMV3]ALG96992.1 hypothetical protein [Sulfolobus monocaudavirus SMV3]